jgi:hypothetical protein
MLINSQFAISPFKQKNLSVCHTHTYTHTTTLNSALTSYQKVSTEKNYKNQQQKQQQQQQEQKIKITTLNKPKAIKDQ